MISQHLHREGFLRLLKFILPFAVWLFLFRTFLNGEVSVNMDTFTIYAVVKYYFNNLLNGEIPLWNPYVHMGRPVYAMALCNLFNPITLIIVPLKWIGLNYYQGFMIYIVLYFWFGAIGFYHLTRQIFQDRLIAYMAYVLFLFCGIGAAVFTQLTLLELCVPAIWFFLFVLRFRQTYRPADFLGMILSLMVSFISYLPFYLATLILIVAVAAFIIYFGAFIDFIRGLGRFVIKRPLYFSAGILALAVAAVPLIAYKMIDASRDIVSPARHCANTSAEQCFEQTLSKEGGMSYDAVSRSGSLAERVDVHLLFSHLDKLSYGSDHFFFVPVWVYMMIALGAFLRITRTSLFLMLTAFILVLVAMGNTAIFHKFLFDHLFFFQYFRNLFFFEAFIMPLLILIAVGQLKQWMAVEPENFFMQKLMLVAGLTAHAACLVYFLRQGHVLPSAYWTVAFSGFVFSLHAFGLLKSPGKLAIVLFLLSVIQPVEVFAHYSRNAREFHCDLPKEHTRPVFEWTRPAVNPAPPCKIFGFVPYEEFWNKMAMQDTTGTIGYPPSVTRWNFVLYHLLGEERFLRYVRHKIYLYDGTETIGDGLAGVQKIAQAIDGNRNTAFVNVQGTTQPPGFQPVVAGKPEALHRDNTAVVVEHFSPNRLTLLTNLDRSRFLVYTDAYTRYWQAFVNQTAVPLYRANGAFKGVVVPAGQARIELVYKPPMEGWVFGGVHVVFLLFAIWTGAELARGRVKT